MFCSATYIHIPQHTLTCHVTHYTSTHLTRRNTHDTATHLNFSFFSYAFSLLNTQKSRWKWRCRQWVALTSHKILAPTTLFWMPTTGICRISSKVEIVVSSDFQCTPTP